MKDEQLRSYFHKKNVYNNNGLLLKDLMNVFFT